MTEKAVLGQAQRILVDATSDIWHKISTWTHASDVEMPDGTPLNTYLTDMNDDINEKFDEKYGSLPNTITDISTFDAIPDLTYGRLHTVAALTDGKYTIETNHYLYSYSGSHPKTIQRFAVLIDTTDLAHLEMYIADKNIENRWTLTRIATQDKIDDLQQQINDLSTEFNNLNLFVQQSIGGLNQLYQVLQDQMDWLEAELAELQEQLNDLLNELRDYKKQTNARLDKLEAVWNAMYGQVGSLFITHLMPSQFYPGNVFGGEWALVNGAYLNATAYTLPEIQYTKDGDSYDFSAMFRGSDGFSLTSNNLPSHFHLFTADGELYLDGYQKKSNPVGLYGIDRQVSTSNLTYDGGDYVWVRTMNEDYCKRQATTGFGISQNGTASAGSDSPEIIKYWPTYFDVHCWLRIA